MSNILSLESFNVRPSMQADEAWPAYLNRFATENGIGGIPELAKIFKVKSNALLCSSPIDNKTQPQIALPQMGTRQKIGSPSAWGRAWNARFCPRCFEAAPAYGRVIWDHPLQLRCPTHQCMLVDRCPDCGKGIQHNRMRIHQCNCDRLLSSIATSTVPAWVMSMEIAFHEAFVGTPTASSTVSETAKSAARVLLAFARCKENPQTYHNHSIWDKTAMVLSTSFEVLKRCFDDSWTGMPNEFMRQIESDPSKKLHHSYQKRKIAAFRHVNALVGSLRDRCDRSRNEPAPQGKMFLSKNRWLTQLSPITGYSPYELKSMAEKGLLEDVRRERCLISGRMQSLIDSDRFSEIEIACKGLPTIAIAANRLSVSTTTVKHLVKKRLLGDISSRPAFFKRLLDHDDLPNLACFLDDCAYFEKNLPAHQRTYFGATLDEIVISHPDTGAAKIFDALKTKILSLHTATDQPNSLGDYYFDRDVFTAWQRNALPVQ